MERLEVVRILKMVALGTSTSPSLSPIFFFYPSRPPLSCSSLSHVLKSFRLSCLLGTDGVYNLSGTPPNLTFISLQELLLHSSSFFFSILSSHQLALGSVSRDEDQCLYVLSRLLQSHDARRKLRSCTRPRLHRQRLRFEMSHL